MNAKGDVHTFLELLVVQKNTKDTQINREEGENLLKAGTCDLTMY